MNIWTIILLVLVVLGSAGGCGWSRLSKEHQEARSVPLDGVDFSHLMDGTYIGRYEGGMYKWRANECRVTVVDSKVTAIELLQSEDPGKDNTNPKPLFDRVIQAQSLEVDTISGATLTSKAYLQAVKNALAQAQGPQSIEQEETAQ